MLTFIKSVLWPFIKNNKYIVMALIAGLLALKKLYSRYKKRQEQKRKQDKELLEKSKVNPPSQKGQATSATAQSNSEVMKKLEEGPSYGARKLSEITLKNDPKHKIAELPENSSNSENGSDEKSTNSTLERLDMDTIPVPRSKRSAKGHVVTRNIQPSAQIDSQALENQIIPIRSAVKITLSTLFASLMLMVFMMIGMTRKMNIMESLVLSLKAAGSI